jgi:hypothetical protein
MAGFNFFGTLVGVGAIQTFTSPHLALISGSISAGFGFFGSLVTQVVLRKNNNRKGDS